MKKLLFFIVFGIIANALYAQPSFALVGFGDGTTGGQGGSTVTVTDYAGLAANVTGTDSKIIRVDGTITGPSGGQILDVGSNKTIVGLGCDATIEMVQLHLKNSNNIIIQNIVFTMIGSTMGSDADMICLETTSTNTVADIWIDHCEFYNITPTLPESAAKKDLYDGMLDIKKSCSDITVSWCYFHDHWKCNLIGYTDDDVYDRRITFHHNRWKNVKSRTPSYRGGTGHIYNNYFEGLLIEDDSNLGVWTGDLISTGVHTRENACLKVENNYFKDYKKAIYNDIEDCTFEGFAHGTGNVFDNSPTQTAATCGSFGLPYSVTMDAATDVPEIVSMWSGVGKIDGTSPILSSPSNKNQEPAGAIDDIVFTWGGSATDVNISGLPAGLNTNKNTGAKTLTISGTASAVGTYTVTTSGGSCGFVSESGTITIATEPSLTISSGSASQTVSAGAPIVDIVYTWAGTATGVNASGLPAGLIGTTNVGAQTYTISGTPTTSGSYTLTTTQSAGIAINVSGNITRLLAVPTGVSASASGTSVTVNWDAVSEATGYIINLCAAGTGVLNEWDFTGTWTINAASADANLEEDATAGRFNYIPATTSAALVFESGSPIADVQDLLFTQGGGSKVRLGYNLGKVYLNGTDIAVSIPCASGNKVTVTAQAGNSLAVDRGFTVSGGTLNTGESSANISATGIMTEAGGTGIYVIDATSSNVIVTTQVGSMNIFTITVTGTGTVCTEYVVAGGATTSSTISGLNTSTTYSYQVKATNATPSAASAYSAAQNVTTGAVATPTNAVIALSSAVGTDAQSHTVSTAITSISYTYTGAYNNIVWTGTAGAAIPPTGISASGAAGVVNISGTPTVVGNYGYTINIDGLDGGSAASATGTIAVLAAIPTLTDPVNKTQTVIDGNAIANIVFTWGGGATDVSVASLPAGLISSKNVGAKTLTISGTPTTGGTYTVSSVGGAGAPIVITGTITVLPAVTCLELVTISLTAVASAGDYDMILFDAAGTTQIKVLGAGTFNAGDSDFVFAKTGLSSGTYTYKLMDGATVLKSGAVILP